MHRLLNTLARALFGLTGTGAIDNARSEVDQAATSVAEVDAQLHRFSEPSRRRAA